MKWSTKLLIGFICLMLLSSVVRDVQSGKPGWQTIWGYDSAASSSSRQKSYASSRYGSASGTGGYGSGSSTKTPSYSYGAGGYSSSGTYGGAGSSRDEYDAWLEDNADNGFDPSLDSDDWPLIEPPDKNPASGYNPAWDSYYAEDFPEAAD